MIVYNNIIPFDGYKCINLFTVIFARKWLNDVDINHEDIHSAQQKETLFIGFFLLYGIEFLARLAIHRDWRKAYRNISFEREACEYEKDFDYLKKKRKHFNFIRLLWKY